MVPTILFHIARGPGSDTRNRKFHKSLKTIMQASVRMIFPFFLQNNIRQHIGNIFPSTHPTIHFVLNSELKSKGFSKTRLKHPYTPLLRTSFPNPVLGSTLKCDLVLECDPEVVLGEYSQLSSIRSNLDLDPNVLPKVCWFGWCGWLG